jgi:glycosyltransferase involved in cell wall biosynthesis
MAPFISIILPVKNGLPHVRAAIDAIRAQTYRNFELLVEDGASTDDSLAYIRSVRDIPNLSVESAEDAGVGEAFNRGLLRCRGDLVCFAAADEMLEPDALEKGVGWFRERPDAVCINGTVRLVNADGCVVQVFPAPRFDLLRHLSNEVVLPFSGFLNRHRIGDELRYDESLKTCPDYDFWIRLGVRFPATDFAVAPDFFKAARSDAASMSFRPESYDQFCRDKVYILNRFMDAQPPSLIVEALRRSATAGIYLWAAECLLGIEGPSQSFMRWCAMAARVTPWSPRLLRLAEESKAFSLDAISGAVVAADTWQPSRPVPPVSLIMRLTIGDTFVDPGWGATLARHEDDLAITTSPQPWQFSAGLRLHVPQALDPDSWYWVRVTLAVDAGAVGIGLFADGDLRGERILEAPRRETEIWLPLTDRDVIVLVRNAHLAKPSTVRLLDAQVESCSKIPPP